MLRFFKMAPRRCKTYFTIYPGPHINLICGQWILICGLPRLQCNRGPGLKQRQLFLLAPRPDAPNFCNCWCYFHAIMYYLTSTSRNARKKIYHLCNHTTVLFFSHLRVPFRVLNIKWDPHFCLVLLFLVFVISFIPFYEVIFLVTFLIILVM